MPNRDQAFTDLIGLKITKNQFQTHKELAARGAHLAVGCREKVIGAAAIPRITLCHPIRDHCQPGNHDRASLRHRDRRDALQREISPDHITGSRHQTERGTKAPAGDTAQARGEQSHAGGSVHGAAGKGVRSYSKRLAEQKQFRVGKEFHREGS